MDVYTAVIFGVIVLVCAAISALISLFGMKTKSYDEAKAEKRTVAETAKLTQHQKHKKNKKTLKKVNIHNSTDVLYYQIYNINIG